MIYVSNDYEAVSSCCRTYATSGLSRAQIIKPHYSNMNCCCWQLYFSIGSDSRSRDVARCGRPFLKKMVWKKHIYPCNQHCSCYWPVPVLSTEIRQTSIRITVWIGNHIYIKYWDAITQSCSNFNAVLIKPLLKIGHGWVIISYETMDVIPYPCPNPSYRKTSYISRTLVGNKIVDNSDVVGASPVGAAPTTSSFST